MLRKNKLIKDIDDEIWRQFTGSCKMENTRVGIKLSKVLKDYLDNGRKI